MHLRGAEAPGDANPDPTGANPAMGIEPSLVGTGSAVGAIFP